MSQKKTTIGGQALIEGIMMRGPRKTCIVVRKTDGELAIKTTNKGSLSGGLMTRIPFIRGVINFIGSMGSGLGAVNYSAEFFAEEEGDPNAEKGKFEAWLDRKLENPKVEKAVMSLTMVIGVLFPVLLFILLPTFLSGLVGDNLPGIVRNLIEGGFRIAIFITFLYFVSKQKDIRRTYMYHGAEHKTIFCYEAGEELTVENVRRHTRFHPRCGTSFLFVVMIISILFFSLFQWSNPWIRMIVRLAMLPVVVAVSYELNRFIGRHDNAVTRILRAPGMWLQRFTTFEPDDSMIAVGIQALKEVIPEEQGEDQW